MLDEEETKQARGSILFYPGWEPLGVKSHHDKGTWPQRWVTLYNHYHHKRPSMLLKTMLPVPDALSHFPMAGSASSRS